MVIVDSTVWIDFLDSVQSKQTPWLEREIPQQRIGLTGLILCEILQGMRESGAFLETERELMKFAVFDSGGAVLAIAAAKNYRSLRAKEHTVRKTIDCLIATLCIERGHSLLHNDRDFEPFEKYLGLQVVHP